jgi:hypothetical protein
MRAKVEALSGEDFESTILRMTKLLHALRDSDSDAQNTAPPTITSTDKPA